MDPVEQTLILVDEEDRVLGYASRGECHAGDGKLHRAIAVLVSDGRGNVLLQKRRSILWDGYWDLAGATHPLHDGDHDETYEEAGRRFLRVEWGIAAPLEPALSFVYFARDGDSAEREHCLLLTGQHDGPVTLNPDHAYALRWVPLDDLRREMASHPEAYTPWALIAVGSLAR